jgi:hypothetical protein
MIYTRSFLNSMKPKLLAKIAAEQLKLDPARVLACTTVRQMDDLYTAPIHGFKDAVDYWTRASSKPWLKQIRIPTLLINAQNDPFLPAEALPHQREVSGSVTLNYPRSGRHLGFVAGNFPANRAWFTECIWQFFTST